MLLGPFGACYVLELFVTPVEVKGSGVWKVFARAAGVVCEGTMRNAKESVRWPRSGRDVHTSSKNAKCARRAVWVMKQGVRHETGDNQLIGNDFCILWNGLASEHKNKEC